MMFKTLLASALLLTAPSAFALSLHVCANGLYYITPLNSNGTPAGPTILGGACSGGDWAVVSQLLVSGGGGGGSLPGGLSDALANISRSSLSRADANFTGTGVIRGSLAAGFRLSGNDTVFRPERVQLSARQLNDVAFGFLRGLELTTR